MANDFKMCSVVVYIYIYIYIRWPSLNPWSRFKKLVNSYALYNVGHDGIIYIEVSSLSSKC